MTTTHTACTHPATKAGRAFCRTNGGPAADSLRVAIALTNAARVAIDSAPCADCLSYAIDSATENLADLGLPATYEHALVEARGYLYDQGALSACPAHEAML